MTDTMTTSGSLLEHYIQSVRDSLGVEQADKDLEFAEGNERMENDRAGNLRMIARNHLFNSSNYSLSSLFRYVIQKTPRVSKFLSVAWEV